MRWTRPADRRTADIHILELAPLRRGPARAQPWPRLGAPRPRRAPRLRRAPAPRPSPASCAAPGSWDRRHGKLPRYALRVPVAGERPRHYKYQSLNEHTPVVREAMERRSAPSPARPATRPRTGRDPRPPLQRDWSAAPPAAPAAPRAAGRPYTEPGCVVRRYHGTFYSILRGLGFFAGLPSGGSWTRAPPDLRDVVLASCDLILNLSFAVKKTSATSDRHS